MGYYTIMLGSEQIGFVAQKYESFPEKKQLKATYYTYARGGGESTTEGLTATCRSGEHTSELQSRSYLVCRLLL